MIMTIGQQLKENRESKNLSIKDVVEEIHIREHYLIAIEEDRIHDILSPVQAKGFIRLYADYLGIDPFATAVPEPEIIDENASDDVDDEPEEISREDETINSDDIVELPVLTFGQQFIDAREENELTFADLEAELHISISYLAAIEQENFEILPQGIQARGLIQRYAEYLGLDEDAVMSDYADLLLATKEVEESKPTKKKPAKKIDGARQFFTPDLIIGVILVSIILVIAFFSVRRVISTRNVISTDTSSEESAFIESTATPEMDLSPTTDLQGTSVPEEIATATLQIRVTNEAEGDTTSRVILQIIANQRAYLRIVSDGETVFEGRVKPGNIYEYYGEEKIEMLTGNAAALDISVIQDGRETRLGTIGLVGQVVSLTFQPDVIITPTVTPSLTPTITNTVVATETPTPTEPPTEEE